MKCQISLKKCEVKKTHLGTADLLYCTVLTHSSVTTASVMTYPLSLRNKPNRSNKKQTEES